MSEIPAFQVLEPLLTSTVDVEHEGTSMRFLVSNPFDLIQRHHAEGKVYEAEELALIAEHFERGQTFVDVGANVGNHAVVAACHLGAAQVIAFEPGLTAHTVLVVNRALNGLSRLEIRKLALSDQPGETLLVTPQPHNLGGSHLAEEGFGQRVETARGDDLLKDRAVDFIKMDVEGHEMKVLDGLSQTVASRRPKLFIEVDDTNRPAFDIWCAANGYDAAATFRRYSTSENVLATPSD